MNKRQFVAAAYDKLVSTEGVEVKISKKDFLSQALAPDSPLSKKWSAYAEKGEQPWKHLFLSVPPWDHYVVNSADDVDWFTNTQIGKTGWLKLVMLSEQYKIRNDFDYCDQVDNKGVDFRDPEYDNPGFYYWNDEYGGMMWFDNQKKPKPKSNNDLNWWEDSNFI